MKEALAGIGLSTPYPQSTVDLIYECRELTDETHLEPVIKNTVGPNPMFVKNND